MTLTIRNLSDKATENLNNILEVENINTKSKALDFVLVEYPKIKTLEDENIHLKHRLEMLEEKLIRIKVAFETLNNI